MPDTLPLLVVEDDDIVRMLMLDVLEELGYEVREAEDGETALALLRSEQQFALMLTDVGLPGIDGKELARQARELRPQLPIMFASGYGQSIDLPEGMHMISKPFGIDQLRDKMKAILG
ncbi:response regulator [Pseudomonas putida CSV86]|uniref:Response regulator n=1 Tax=Pseudomonas bharatica CSV86 TaxID=1005395 RepID=L1M673_9PSED|nr:response regulator [Pseudomonas bharatica]NNJ15332.1 response regulator [Pseudomonas bharatica CSV86]